MKNYTVRVELHRADEDDYTRLRSLMESAGFVRWIEGKSGALKRLPTAEYNMTDTSLTRGPCQERRDLRQAAAGTVDSRHGIGGPAMVRASTLERLN